MDESQTDSAISNKPTTSENIDELPQDEVDAILEPKLPKPIFNKEHLHYDMSGEKYLLIFNHFKYEKSQFYGYVRPRQRNGTEKDVRSLKNVFTSLGFKVLTYSDLTHDEILDRMSRISKQDHSMTSCLALAILTHGDAGGCLYAADRTYKLKDIANLLEYGDSHLVNKPKLFFIQACRGDLADPGRTVYLDGPGSDSTFTVPSHSDFLYMFSTVEEHVSWRDANGSWMIQEFCDVLKNYSGDFDLLHLITIATRNVAYGRSSNTPKDKSMHKKKQTPETRYTLTKLVKFQ